MPTTRSFLLCTTTAATILIGSALNAEQLATEQEARPEHHQSAAQLWAAKSIVELEPKAQTRTAAYDRCAARLRADYDDDPARAYEWVRTLCRP
jgi:hypothetical protein